MDNKKTGSFYYPCFYLHEKQKDPKKTKDTRLFLVFFTAEEQRSFQDCHVFNTGQNLTNEKGFHEKNTDKEHFNNTSIPALQSQSPLRDSPGEVTHSSAAWLLDCLLPGGVSWLRHLCKKPGDSKVNFQESTSYPNQTGFLVTTLSLNSPGERFKPFNPFFLCLFRIIYFIFSIFLLAIFCACHFTGKRFKTQWDFNSM